MINRPTDAELVAIVERAAGDGRRVTSYAVLDDKPGMRCVASATVTPAIPDEAGGPPIGTVFAKWFHDGPRGRRNHDTLAALATALRDDRRVRVPAPLGFDAERRVLLMGAVSGRPWGSLGIDGSADPEGWGRTVGAAMAALHRSGAAVPAEYVIGDEVRTVHQWADQLAGETPPAELLTRYRALVERVEAASSSTTLTSDAVIHRDLHEEHLFIDPGSSDSASVGVIDLDEARRGDPVVDLAHLAVHLHLASGTAGTEVRRGPFRGVEEAWRHGTGRTPALDGFAIQVAFTALKIARQRALGYGTRPRPVGADRWPEIDRVLRLGEAWITRAE